MRAKRLEAGTSILGEVKAPNTGSAQNRPNDGPHLRIVIDDKDMQWLQVGSAGMSQA